MKVVKWGELKTLWKYRKKQKQKVELCLLLESLAKQETRDGIGAGMLQHETAPARSAGRLESVEMTQQ